MAIARAREPRRNPTDAEERLWSRLRLGRIDGHRFRRQAPIGRHIVDFVCFARFLVIEADGGQHAIGGAPDARRTAWLEGFRGICFSNNDVLGDIDGVPEVVRAELARSHSPPQPSPTRAEGA